MSKFHADIRSLTALMQALAAKTDTSVIAPGEAPVHGPAGKNGLLSAAAGMSKARSAVLESSGESAAPIQVRHEGSGGLFSARSASAKAIAAATTASEASAAHDLRQSLFSGG